VSELTRSAIAKVDPAGMLDDVLAQPDQVTDALWRVEAAGVPSADLAGGVVVAGMGGSAIGGDLAAAALGSRARRPIRTVRGYELEPGTTADTLVVCASYSGDTEETLACFAAAGELGAPRVAVTTGGALADTARAGGVPVIGVPSGMQPRAAVVYMTVAALECAAGCGAAPSLREEIETAVEALRAVAAQAGPDSPQDSEAKLLAAALNGTVPVIHGAGRTAAVARRWKTQLNENANVPAFFSELPEADHNEVCGYPGDVPPFAAVFLDDAGLDARLRQRIEVTAEVVGEAGARVHMLVAPGESGVERVLGSVLMGDLVSVYVAAIRGIDPTPVDAIGRLKARLGSG
jgi:glucose/mannose-6-phosphate isomerase